MRFYASLGMVARLSLLFKKVDFYYGFHEQQIERVCCRDVVPKLAAEKALFVA